MTAPQSEEETCSMEDGPRLGQSRLTADLLTTPSRQLRLRKDKGRSDLEARRLPDLTEDFPAQRTTGLV